MSSVMVESRDKGKKGTKIRPGMISRDEALRRWPRIIAHMMCTSLGYFAPLAAANALAHHKSGKPYACEWYSHMCHCKGKGFFDELELLTVGRDVVKSAIEMRHHHRGYMTEYRRAIQLVNAELEQKGCTADMLAGWF